MEARDRRDVEISPAARRLPHAARAAGHRRSGDHARDSLRSDEGRTLVDAPSRSAVGRLRGAKAHRLHAWPGRLNVRTRLTSAVATVWGSIGLQYTEIPPGTSKAATGCRSGP